MVQRLWLSTSTVPHAQRLLGWPLLVLRGGRAAWWPKVARLFLLASFLHRQLHQQRLDRVVHNRLLRVITTVNWLKVSEKTVKSR